MANFGKRRSSNTLPTLHPLISVVDLSKATRTVDNCRMNYDVYAIYLKNDANCKIKYGRKYYDYQEGTIVSFAPGQYIEVENVPTTASPNVLGLLFHPDLIHGTPLARKISKYTFFDYEQAESLHLSAQERSVIVDCFNKIALELQYPVDSHSRELLVMQIELVLEYCLRFYDRQFCTRAKVNSDTLMRFQELLNHYFDEEEYKSNGLPTVKYFADRVCLSSGYFGDLIKKETGRTAQEIIQDKLIHLSKEQLLHSNAQISEIAYSLGFQYPQHFIRLFKRQVGLTPKEWREENLIL